MDFVNLYLLTFNCARTPIDVGLFAAHLFDALPSPAPARSRDNPASSEPPELIVLCLQEIAPIAYAFLGGSYLAPYFGLFDKAVDQAVSKRWGAGYARLVRENTGMTGLLVYARSDVAGKVSRIDTARVGVGFYEMGNKGAVGARLGYLTDEQDGQPMDLTFIAAHLAPMEFAVEQRNADWRSIVERLVFSKRGTGTTAGRTRIEGENGTEEGTALLRDSEGGQDGMFVPTTYLFFGGDLNYRTSSTRPTENDHARFPRSGADPSSPAHYSQLLKDDQLAREMRLSRSLHGLSEAPIDFPPTYKYRGLGRNEDDWRWALGRWPSWCDRILYLDTPSWMPELPAVKQHAYEALPLFPTSDHRPVALAISVPLKAIRLPDEAEEGADVRLAAPFPLDPDWEAKRNSARAKEVIVGLAAYLGLTWEGNGILLASAMGVLGTWLVLRSLAV
jgi:hypothetical protein